MSLMGGFDIIIELSNKTVLMLIENTLHVTDGGVANPPFDLTLPLPNGSLNFIVDTLALDLKAGDVATVTASFSNSSVIMSPLVVSLLTGRLLFDVSVAGAVIDFSKATGSIVLDDSRLDQALTALSPGDKQALATSLGVSVASLTSAQFVQLGGAVVKALLAMQKPLDLTGIMSLPGITTVTGHCIPNADPNRQSLAICGSTLGATGQDFSQKTESAIPLGDAICISVSSTWFQNEIFCPTLQTALNVVKHDDMPPTCGPSGGLKVPWDPVDTLTRLDMRFGDNRLHVQISARGSIDVADFSFTINASAPVYVDKGEIKIGALTLDGDPQSDFELKGWVYALAAFTGGAFAVSSTAAVMGILHDKLPDIIKDQINSRLPALNKALSDVHINTSALGVSTLSLTVPTVFITHISMTPEGLTVSGTLSFSAPSARFRQITLVGSVMTVSLTNGNTGEIHLACTGEDYPYTEQWQQQAATYRPEVRLMGQPLALEWSLSGKTTTVGLGSASGPVTSPPLVTSDYLFAPTVDLFPSLTFNVLSPTVTVELRNSPPDGNYRLWLSVRATDPAGNEEFAAVEIDFEGDYLDAPAYKNDLAKCLAAAVDKIRHEVLMPPGLILSPLVPVDHPTPEDLRSFIGMLLRMGGETALDLVAEAKLAHGNSFNRALADLNTPPSSVGALGTNLPGGRSGRTL